MTNRRSLIQGIGRLWGGVCVFLAIAGGSARADEGGVPFWLSGQFASLSAVPATPGFSAPVLAYYYTGDASADKSFTVGNAVTLGLDSRFPLLFIQPTYVPAKEVLGGRGLIGIGFGYGANSVVVDVSFSNVGVTPNRSDRQGGFADLYPMASIAWNRGVNNWMTYVTGDIPVGSYDSERLANIGIGHAAVDAGGGYTYLNSRSGHEFSAVIGFTYNWTNTDTDYQNGIDSHLDWGASQFLSEAWEVGLAGYVYNQLTGDSGSGAKLGAFKSKVASIGPEVGYVFTLAGMPSYANMRGYWEFWAENRLQGYAIFTTVVVPLGPRNVVPDSN